MFVVVDGGRRVRIFLEIMADASEESDTSTDVDVEEDGMREYFYIPISLGCTSQQLSVNIYHHIPSKTLIPSSTELCLCDRLHH